MRKPVSCALVGLMLLSLFGFFGGVVEEAEGTATYDSGSNTILINSAPNTLSSIFAELNPTNPGIFYYNSIEGYYSTNASIQINIGGRLDITYSGIEKALLFDYNSTQSLNFTIFGTLMVTGSEPNLFRFDSNNSIPNRGDWKGLKFQGSEASNSSLNSVGVFNASTGIMCDNSDPIIINSQISENLINGFFIFDSSPEIKDNNILNNGDGGFTDGGVYALDSTTLIENCTLTNSPYNDILLQGSAVVTMLNSTFNTVLPSGASFEFIVKWYLHALVLDDGSFAPISGADINIKDNTGTSIPGTPFITDSNGYVRWIKIVEYTQNSSSGTVNYNPYNLTANHPEYYEGWAQPEPSIDTSQTVQINLTMIRRDLTTYDENITFSPLPNGVAIAEEDLFVNAKIHNIEVDNASMVRVIIEDDGDEIYNSIIILIEGYSFEKAIDQWQPDPGLHTITVYIDPFDEISEVNSNPAIDAENNNEVSVDLPVNARPIVSFWEPSNNSEVSGTTTVLGTSWDDLADNIPELPGNEISRIDIRLGGYDWIVVDPPYDLNFSTFGRDWDYDWDTNYWDGNPLTDGNYTLQARAWDNYHESFIFEVPITVNNTGGNEPPIAGIYEPADESSFSVNETITFNGSDSSDPDNDTLTYEWEFGDGNIGSGMLIIHSYSQKGTYLVNLTVDDSQVQNSTQITIYIDNFPPNAVVTSSTDTGYVNDTITFYGYNSTDADNPILNFTWDFDNTTDTNGDGNFTNDPDFISITPIENASFIYTQPRTYVVTLRVWDGRINSTDTVTVQILDNAAPTAVISQPLTLQSFDVNETIIFNATESSDPNDDTLEYFWDFGDGTNSSWINEPITTYAYSDKGANPPIYDYIVTLIVRDDEGSEDTAPPVTILVNNYPPVANATSNVTTSPTYQDITFDGSNSYDPEGFGITSYLWDFDDGNTSSDDITSHQFANDGDYNVTLVVTDSAGANDTDWIIITITNRDPVINNVTLSPSQPIMNEEITFTVNATDDDGIIVEYEWNFGDTGIYSETAANAPDGAFDGKTTHSYPSKTSYSVTVIVKDDDGAYNSTQFWVDIANTPPDTEITFPNENDQVSGTITIEGTSDDLDGSVSKVEVKIDNEEWQLASGTDPWTFSWDTSSVYNGQHTIYARAYDSQNYTNPPANKTVDVSNSKSSITLTVNLDPTTVETGGVVIVYGDAIYNTGEPVANADVNISVFNEGVNWITKTNVNGFYSQNITAPSDAGSYLIKASITRSGLSDSEQERLTVEVPPSQPDLQISSSDIIFNKNDPFSGEIVQITVGVNNIGTDAAQDVVVNAYYGDPASGGRPTSPDSTKTISQIPGGETGFTTFNWDTSDITGSQDIYIVVDPGNSISESNEDNNKDYKSITIEGRADFEIDSDDITFSNDNPTVDDTISIFIDIRNIGTERKGVKYKVYDGDPDDTGVLIDSGEETINGDDEANLIITWTPDEAGTHLVYVVLEPKTGVEESDDSNNEASASITVEEKPGDDGSSSNLLPMIIVLVVIVLLIIVILYRRGQGEKPQQQNIPSASVIQKTSVAKVVEPKKEKEEEPMMDGQGGMRI